MVTDIQWLHSVSINNTTADPCKVALPLRITHGRSSSASQPDAPECEFTWLGSAPPGSIGDSVVVRLTLVGSGPIWIYDAPDNYTYDSSSYVWDNQWTADAGTRFTGIIDSLTANEVWGGIESWSVSCIGLQAGWGTVQISPVRPQETDIARVQAIGTASGMAPAIRGTSNLLLAAETITDDSLAAMHKVCESSAGLVWQSKAGLMHYGTSNHRRVDPKGVLTCDPIRDGLAWTKQVEQVINHVTVKFAGGEAALEDSASIAQWGMRHIDVSTTLARQVDADALAGVIISRRAQPYWLMPGVLVYPDKAARPDQSLLASLEISDIILIPVMSEPGAVPSALDAWVVEGWVEERAATRTTIQYSLSDAGRWVQTRIRNWDEARQFTWAQEASGSWLNALIVEGV